MVVSTVTSQQEGPELQTSIWLGFFCMAVSLGLCGTELDLQKTKSIDGSFLCDI